MLVRRLVSEVWLWMSGRCLAAPSLVPGAFGTTSVAIATINSTMEGYAKLGDGLCDHVADLRGRQFLIILSRGFA